jgi:hypothetical protein
MSFVAERARFIGRTRELEAVRQRWAEGARLVTLVGPPGSGKSRLARRIAAEDAAVVIIDVRSPAEAVETRRSARDLHASSPCVRVLVTARRRLRSNAEAIVYVGALTKVDAVALYEQRARLSDHDFELTDATRPIVEDIVDRLDRLPLAVELAASRIGVLKPRDLLSRLGSRFDLLRTDETGGDPRHVALVSALEEEWRALPAWARTALCQLAALSGSFSLCEAEQALDLRAHHPSVPSVIDALAELCDACCLVSEAGGGLPESRFRLYESVRALATCEASASAREIAASTPVLRLLPRMPPTGEPVLVVGRPAHWFSMAAQDRVDLSTRAPLQRILECLVDARAARPGTGVSSDELVAAGWPAERMSRSAGLHRVHVAVATLRKMGLGAMLVTNRAGYLLGPHVAISREARQPNETGT